MFNMGRNWAFYFHVDSGVFFLDKWFEEECIFTKASANPKAGSICRLHSWKCSTCSIQTSKSGRDGVLLV